MSLGLPFPNAGFDREVLAEQTTGITLDALNIARNSAISFNYNPITGALQVGGIEDTTEMVQYGGPNPATNDFLLQVGSFDASSPVFTQLLYAQANAGNNFI
jgi:hypothetical protein